MKTALRGVVHFSLSGLLLVALAACGGGGGGGGGGTMYTVGGTVTGLTGSGLVLENNASGDLPISAAGTFTFAAALASGAAYAVTVKTQPSSPTQDCVVSNGSGMGTANVTNVAVVCTTAPTYDVSGTVTGLAGRGLVLEYKRGVATIFEPISGAGRFNFITGLPSGATYSLGVETQPSSPVQHCVITNGSGTIGTVNVNNVAVVCADVTPTIAVTQSGAVQGVVEGNVLAFRGIPFAAPPVGNLRWQSPQSPANWVGVRDASSFGSVCPQLNGNNQPIGDEDCLFLNVFMSIERPHNQPQAVMVFIHGGGNRQGSSNAPNFDAPPLATQGVILVTIQYRLGMLGFLVHPLLDAEGGGASGNYGLMDQIAALTWVHNNIASFGGDPTRVMVFGQSAGSFDVEPLLVSPLAKGLFSSAGMESGAFIHGQYLALSDMEPLEAPLVQAVGCNNAADVLACLRGVPANMVVANTGAIPTIPGDDRCRSVVIEPRALPVDPFDALQQNGSPVPLLIGSTREEESGQGASDDPTAMPPLTEAGYEAALHADFDSLGTSVAHDVLTRYPASSYGGAPVYALIAAETDYFDITPTRNVARAAAKANGPPVWRYLYTHTFENDPNLSPYRAYHTSELPFVFGNPSINPNGPHTPTAAELTLAMQMMGYWSQFAKTGNPNGTGSTLWPRYDASTDAMLQLDDTQTVINGYHNAQDDFFTSLIP
jgi:para-nitrobenzyl esterase